LEFLSEPLERRREHAVSEWGDSDPGVGAAQCPRRTNTPTSFGKRFFRQEHRTLNTELAFELFALVDTTSWQNAGRTTAHVCIGPIAPNMRRFSPGTAAPCGIRLGWPTRVASRERAPCWRGRWRGERLTSVALNLELVLIVLIVLVVLVVLVILVVPDVLHVGGGGGQSRSWNERRHQGWSTRRLRRPCAARSEAMEHKLRGKVTLQWQTGE